MRAFSRDDDGTEIAGLSDGNLEVFAVIDANVDRTQLDFVAHYLAPLATLGLAEPVRARLSAAPDAAWRCDLASPAEALCHPGFVAHFLGNPIGRGAPDGAAAIRFCDRTFASLGDDVVSALGRWILQDAGFKALFRLNEVLEGFRRDFILAVEFGATKRLSAIDREQAPSILVDEAERWVYLRSKLPQLDAAIALALATLIGTERARRKGLMFNGVRHSTIRAWEGVPCRGVRGGDYCFEPTWECLACGWQGCAHPRCVARNFLEVERQSEPTCLKCHPRALEHQ